MAQYGKSAARRGKPSYIMSIVGVTLVLFLLGLVGWLVINANKLGDYFRENVEVRAFFARRHLKQGQHGADGKLCHKALCEVLRICGQGNGEEDLPGQQ